MAVPHFLPRPEGRIAFDDTGGTGRPLVVCVPGLGDLRSEYRFLTPILAAAGFRVVTMDLRGHGESDATFTDHERPTAGDDVIALLDHLDVATANLIGTSYGAAAVTWAAAQAPERVRSVTLIGPFVRAVPVSLAQRWGLRILFARPWGVAGWINFYDRLWGTTTAPDHAAHRASLRDNLREPGRLAAVRAMATSTCEAIDPCLDDLPEHTLVVMGTADPDFEDPADEARLVADRMRGQIALIEGAGHYPHVEQPDTTGTSITAFLTSATSRP